MPLRAFTRLTDRLLVHLGEKAVLRGEWQSELDPPRLERMVNVKHGAEFADVNDQAIFQRSIATLRKADGPHTKNDSLWMLNDLGEPYAYFALDALVKDNGYTEQWVIVGAPAPVVPDPEPEPDPELPEP